MKLSVYADGSSGGNSLGAGGYGWLIVLNETEVICGGNGGEVVSTNNKMELMGALEGLKALFRHSIYLEQSIYKDPIYKDLDTSSRTRVIVELVSDSQYVLGLADGIYAATKNVELADELRQLCIKHKVITRWVKGHSGDPCNEIADKLAKAGKIDNYSPEEAEAKMRKANKKKRKTLDEST